jgi:hypothetical protein
MTRARIAIAFALLGACAASEEPSEGPRPLRTFSARLDDDPMEAARAALERDAWRREHRFREAVAPGYEARATRLSQAEIDAGAWSNEALFEIGAQLFHLTWTRELGLGGRDRPAISRFHLGRRGGPDASRCASCHWRGGPAGAGDAADNAYLDGDGETQASALARNPRPLHGLGLLEALAREMTEVLATERRDLIALAERTGTRTSTELTARGVSFGVLAAEPGGHLDTTGVRGIDPDLVVRPFGWRGQHASIRDVIEDELLLHHGIETDALVAEADPDRVGPFGGNDPDGDGVVSEATEGQLTALVLFAAMQEIPVSEPPLDPRDRAAFAEGETLFTEIGCAECHRPSIHLESPLFRLEPRAGGPTREIDLATEGADPRITSCTPGGCDLHLFSDLRRHDMGSNLADPRDERTQFLTPPLWGIARSRPYLHDGRAPTLEDAITAHAGEAEATRDAYLALEPSQRGAIRVYLTSLTRARRLIAP